MDYHTHTMTNASNAILEPVSTTGKTSVKIDAEVSNQTVTPMTFVKYARWSTNTGTNRSEVDQYTTTTANTEYLMENFQIKASQACGLYLDQETVFNYSTAATSTLGKTLRLALVVSKSDGSNPKYFFYTIDDVATSGAVNTTFNVTAYIWMEGCDGDTVAANLTTLTGAGNAFNAVLGFCAK